MSEYLFRFHVVRPAVSPDPRYPPLRLAQTSDFQTVLARAAQTPTNPRSAMDSAANSFLASPKFISDSSSDPNLTRIDKATGTLDTLSTAGLTHVVLQAALTTAIGTAPAAFLAEAWLAIVESNIKDSIVALRHLGIESKLGQVDSLSRRLRTIDTIQKTSDDSNFPLSPDDLTSWRLRPIVAPTLFDLKSILSMAQDLQQQRQVAAITFQAGQARVASLYQARLDLSSTLDGIMALSPVHRIVSPPVALPPPVVSTGPLSPAAIANSRLQMVNQYHSLALKQFNLNLTLTDRIAATIQPAAGPNSDLNPNLTRPTINLTSVGENPIDRSAASSLVDMSRNLLEHMQQIKPVNDIPPFALRQDGLIHFALKPTALDALSATAKQVLKNENIDLTAQAIDSTVRQLQNRLASNAAALDGEYKRYANPVAKVSRLGGVTVFHKNPAVAPWALAFATGERVPPAFETSLPEQSFGGTARHASVLGMADLIVAKQQLVGYQKGDVAYVQNVLKGESTVREITATQQVTSTTMVETENTTASSSELSTADRFETSTECDKTIKEAESLKAGMTLNSYGPSVSVSANVSGSMDRSKDESSKASSNYAREVTNKAAESISKRVLTRVQTTTMDTNEQKETHTLENKDPKRNTSGVYQWVNKVYQAQNWYYGQRVMLDFMLPEPGAFLMDKAANIASQKPEDVTFVPSFVDDDSKIAVETYSKYAGEFGVADISPPPALISRKAVSYAAGPSTEHFHSEVVAIPAGYSVEGISCQVTGTGDGAWATSWVGVICGESFRFQWDPRSNGNMSYSDNGNHEQNEVAFSVTAQGMLQLSCNVEFLLKATQEAKDNWRRDTYIKLKIAHEKLVDAQKDSIQRAKFSSAVAGSPGQNPAANLVTMRNEIKKMCIETITDQHFDKRSAIAPSSTVADDGLAISEIDLDSAWKYGPAVRFFEEAFEWEQMTWLTYPYFWARKQKWFQKVAYEDDDPVYQDFMRAGFARANVPIRPGFEAAVDHFLTTGQIWNGGPLPGLTSELFLPIAAEIQERLGKPLAEPVPYGDPWTVNVPTNLVKLRLDDDLPFWALKGKDWVPNEDKLPVVM